ncbi:hypothetical protein BKA80DRAFT_258186 [Phyllosticta citrichinensis]
MRLPTGGSLASASRGAQLLEEKFPHASAVAITSQLWHGFYFQASKSKGESRKTERHQPDKREASAVSVVFVSASSVMMGLGMMMLVRRSRSGMLANRTRLPTTVFGDMACCSSLTGDFLGTKQRSPIVTGVGTYSALLRQSSSTAIAPQA